MSTMSWYAAPTDEEALSAVRKLYREAYGTDPWGVFSAPGRANLIGEHIDYSGGTVLPFALPHRTYIAVSPRHDGVLRGRSAQEEDSIAEVRLSEIGPGSPSGWMSYVAGVAWAMEQEGLGSIPGADFVVDSSVPLGAGLSSSAALECAAALAWDAMGGSDALLSASDAGRARLASACVRAENEVAGASTGGMDQAVSLRAAEGSVLAIDCRDFSTRAVDVDVESANLSLLVVDTKAPHRLVDGQYAQRRAVCDGAARALGLSTLRDAFGETARLEAVPGLLEQDLFLDGTADDAEGQREEIRRLLRHAWSEMARAEETMALFSSSTPTVETWSRLGTLLDQSHDSLRHDYRVTVPELDLAVDAARAAGALGARMIGGGFGGSILALVRQRDVETVASAVAAAFADQGRAAPEFLQAVPSPAARRDA